MKPCQVGQLSFAIIAGGHEPRCMDNDDKAFIGTRKLWPTADRTASSMRSADLGQAETMEDITNKRG